VETLCGSDKPLGLYVDLSREYVYGYVMVHNDSTHNQNAPIVTSPLQWSASPACTAVNLPGRTHRREQQEQDSNVNYMGARFYDPDFGRFLQVDPAREFWNSYSYVGNNPVMGTDPTGESLFALFWNTNNGEIGHASLAIQNYDSNGNFDGTYTIFGKWPVGDGAGKKNFDQNVGVSWENYQWSGDLEDYTVNGDETHGPTGIIEITTSVDFDIELTKSLRERTSSYKESYNGVEANCSTFVCDVLNANGFKVSGYEQLVFGQLKTYKIPFFKTSEWKPGIWSVTPNQLFKDLRKVPGTKVISEPQKIPLTIKGLGVLAQLKTSKPNKKK